jgi:hypothetical protein
MNIDNSTGNVGIGVSPAYRLDVATDASTSYAGNFFNDGNNDNRYGIQIQAGADTPSAGKWIQFNDGDGGDVGTISLLTGTLTLTTTSDQRLKQDIGDTDLTLDTLMNIKVRDFAYIRDPNTRVHGFVAQELYEAYPDAVVVPTNPNDYWKVSYSQLTPLIVKSVQDLNLKIEGIASLDLENTISVGSLIKTFLSDMGNSLDIVFFGEVHAKKLCLSDGTEDVCVTKDELKQLKQLLGQANASATVITSGTGSDASGSGGLSSGGELGSGGPATGDISNPPADTGSTDTGTAGDSLTTGGTTDTAISDSSSTSGQATDSTGSTSSDTPASNTTGDVAPQP